MAIVKARESEPVRNLYMTTVHTGRNAISSNKGFGLARLGGLINAQVEGLPGGGTGAARLQSDKGNPVSDRVAELETKIVEEAERQRVEQHKSYKQDRKAVYEERDKLAKEGAEVEKKLAAKANKTKTETPKKEVEVVDGRAVAPDHEPAEVLNDPTKLAKADKKTKEQVENEAPKPAEKK